MKGSALTILFGVVFSLIITQNTFGGAKDVTATVVDNFEITGQDIQQAMVDAKKTSAGDVSEEQVLKKMIESQLLLEEAKKRGIHKRPEIRKKLDFLIKNVLVQQLISESIGDLKPITEEDARKLYDENWKGARYPRMVHLSKVSVEYKSDAAAEIAKEYAALLRKRMAELQFSGSDEFIASVTKELPPPAGVVLRGKDDKKLVLAAYKQYQAVHMAVASTLKEGEVGGPVEIPQHSYEIFKIIKEHQSSEIPFSRVASDLMMSASELQYQEKLDRFVEELKKSHSVEINKAGKDTPVR